MSKGWPAFMAVSAVVIAIALIMDSQGVVLPAWQRVLLSFLGVVLAVLAGKGMAAYRGRRGDA